MAQSEERLTDDQIADGLRREAERVQAIEATKPRFAPPSTLKRVERAEDAIRRHADQHYAAALRELQQRRAADPPLLDPALVASARAVQADCRRLDADQTVAAQVIGALLEARGVAAADMTPDPKEALQGLYDGWMKRLVERGSMGEHCFDILRDLKAIIERSPVAADTTPESARGGLPEPTPNTQHPTPNGTVLPEPVWREDGTAQVARYGPIEVRITGNDGNYRTSLHAGRKGYISNVVIWASDLADAKSQAWSDANELADEILALASAIRGDAPGESALAAPPASDAAPAAETLAPTERIPFTAEEFAAAPPLEQVMMFERWTGIRTGYRGARALADCEIDRAQSDETREAFIKLSRQFRQVTANYDSTIALMGSVDAAHKVLLAGGGESAGGQGSADPRFYTLGRCRTCGVALAGGVYESAEKAAARAEVFRSEGLADTFGPLTPEVRMTIGPDCGCAAPSVDASRTGTEGAPDA